MSDVKFKGRLGKEITLEATRDGKEKAKFSLAKYVGKNKENEWINVIAYDWLARKLSKATVGQMISIEGNLRNPQYTNANGENRSYFYVEASDGDLIQKVTADSVQNNYLEQQEYMGNDDEELPF